MVLPPGNWDRNVLLPILIAQSRAIAVRRKIAKAGKETTVRGRENPFIRNVCLCPLQLTVKSIFVILHSALLQYAI